MKYNIKAIIFDELIFYNAVNPSLLYILIINESDIKPSNIYVKNTNNTINKLELKLILCHIRNATTDINVSIKNINQPIVSVPSCSLCVFDQ